MKNTSTPEVNNLIYKLIIIISIRIDFFGKYITGQ